MQALCGLDRQCAAGGKHPAHGAQGRPVEVVAHALEQRRAGDPGKRRMLATGALQVFRKGQLPAHERTPGAQRPEHPEQQAIDVLGGNAADDACRTEIGTPQLFQGFDLVGQLPQAFFDALGLATGPGRTQAQPALIQIQRGGTERRLPIIAEVRIVGLIGQPQVHLVRPALARLRLQVGRQQHAGPGTPGAQQGNRQIGGVFKVHGNALHAQGLQAGGQVQGLCAQVCVIERRLGRDGTLRLGLEQQLLKFYPIHGWPRTRCRISHSMANIRPINP
ncbi:hypothetical protein D3C84_629560 [compost metagenome]